MGAGQQQQLVAAASPEFSRHQRRQHRRRCGQDGKDVIINFPGAGVWALHQRRDVGPAPWVECVGDGDHGPRCQRSGRRDAEFSGPRRVVVDEQRRLRATASPRCRRRGRRTIRRQLTGPLRAVNDERRAVHQVERGQGNHLGRADEVVDGAPLVDLMRLFEVARSIRDTVGDAGNHFTLVAPLNSF